MSLPDFEEEYLDVLQNIEAAIVNTYRDRPELTDYEVDRAIEALARGYQGEARGREPVLPRNEQSLAVYQAVQRMCEWRLGREQMLDQKKRPMKNGPEPLSVEEIVLCLKRIRKSIQTWTKEGGRQGYLNYISQFL